MMVALYAVLVLSPAYAGAKASAFEKHPKQANQYNAGSAIDGKPETCWSVPSESPNRGESISLEIPKGEVEKIGIIAGWDKDETSFKDYPRVKQLRVDIYTLDNDQAEKLVGSETLDVADVRGLQVLPLKAKAKVGDDSFFGGKVKLSVVDIYPGDDFPNLRVSEVAVYMGEMDAKPAITVLDAAALTDGNAKTLWAGAAGTAFEVTPNGWAVSSIGFQVARRSSSDARSDAVLSRCTWLLSSRESRSLESKIPSS